jgi:predicted nuclease of restriction endonuclease-like RecB superfamily
VLTADLVHARRRGNELRLVLLDGEGRERACLLAEQLVAITAAHVGRTREELGGALAAVDTGPREHRLRDGLVKLLEDRCDFDGGSEADPEAARRAVFTRASAAREALEPGARFDRAALLAAVAAERSVTPEALERALFADLRGAHVLAGFEATTARALVDLWTRAQAQAVLLRAVKVTVDVRCRSAQGLRTLFRKLKFLRLLHSVEAHGEGHRVVIDGPFSLFESVTKYGLQLAMVLPALEGCEQWKLEAEVRWGKERAPLVFRLSGSAGDPEKEAPLPDEVEALVRAFEALDTEWRVSESAQILELPGIGLCVPDLVFERGERQSRQRVFLEVMGYWSRAAVWKRVELVQAGLAERVIFAVSARLRVSEEVLGDDVPGGLYVYKQAMSARAIAERLEKIAPSS